MKDIIFKAKRLDDGEWVEGWYCKDTFGKWPVKPCIIPWENAENGYLEHVMVDGDTVCQYTGLTDKNGEKIFEGDKLCVSKGEPYGQIGFVRIITGCWIIEFSDSWDFLDNVKIVSEVIGNIHDKE